MDIPLLPGGNFGRLSELFPVTGVIFRETEGDYHYDWHPAPRRQFIIMLDAGVEITAGDGTRRIINAGEILLVEDTHGRGHLSRALNNQPRKSICITLD
jgi:hypothetical protein